MISVAATRVRIGVLCTAVLFGTSLPVDAVPAAAVDVFSPQGTVKDVRQVAVRFSEPMVAFGDPRLPEPFVVDCAAPGRGRWADTRNWIYDFESELPAGLVCRFTLHDGLRSHAGAALTGRRQYTFNTGGPSVRASLPMEGDSDVDTDQVFVLALDAEATHDSVARHAACAIENVAERVPVDVLEGPARDKVLAQRRRLGYRYLQLFGETTHESRSGDARAEIARLESRLTVLRCRRSLPPDTKLSLIWGRGIAAATGQATDADQVLDFQTRPDFTVRTECERVNPNAPCLPMRPLRVIFSAPVPSAIARGLKVSDASRRTYAPAKDEDERAPFVESLRYEGPFPERGTLTITLGVGLKDDAGRAPANADRFPLEVPLDEYPPLVKFAAQFGVLESAAGGVLPVTVRNVEPQLAGRRAVLVREQGVPGQTLRVGRDRDIANWLRRVEKAMERRGDWTDGDGDQPVVWRELTGSESVFTESDATSDLTVPVPANGRAFEVIGIPLPEPGFYVVELASPRLGQALLDQSRPRYVASAALVTNMAVHFKWGREASRVWVTALDTGRPMRDAKIRISGYCSGRPLWEGETDDDGIAAVSVSFGKPHGNSGCNEWSPEPLMVSARLDRDLSFALSGWQDGISPSDFGTPFGWDGERGTYLAHTVFDRTLLRAGETVSMKHFFRQHVSSGLQIPPAELREPKRPPQPLLPHEIVLTHSGSGQTFRLPVRFDAAGIAESSWRIPQDARLGDYQVELVRDERDGSSTFHSGAFRVEQYRVPTMRAVIQPPSRALVRPKDVTFDLFVSYLAGGGASGAPVRLRTMVEPAAQFFREFPDFAFGGGDVKEGIFAPDARDDEEWWYASRFGYERPVSGAGATTPAEVQPLVLDAQGVARATVKLPVIDAPRSLVAELEYDDANGERLTTATRVQLWPAALSLGIRTEGWVAAQDDLRFKVVAVDPTGKPLANRRVNVDVFKRDTYSYRTRLIGGFYAYESKVEVKRLDAGCEGRTNAKGLVSCQIAPEVSGEIVLRASAEDEAGNLAMTSTTAWVAGGEDWWFAPGNADRMDLLPEQKEYEPGGEARFQVRSPFRSATALVTVEREGVLESFVTRISGRNPVIKVPIADAYAPNVYVSVLAVRGRIAGWRAWLADLVRRLGVSWRLEGGAATALADLSKPAFRLGVAQIRVGWSAQRLQVKVTPSSETFRVRDKAIVDVQVQVARGRRPPAGAELAFAAVDEGLLELRPNDSWALLDAMMNERPIEVWTSTAQMQVVGKRHYGRKAVPAGGGGGRAGARELFDTLLLWRGRVKLDAVGRARVEVPLNDSLTSFRLVAVANVGDQYFGTGEASIRTTQELMLHSGLAPLVREGDRYTASFTLRNASKRRMIVRATAKIGAEPIPTPDVSSSKARSDSIAAGSAPSLKPVTVELAAGGARDLAWPATAPTGVGSLGWTVEAVEVDGQARDALRVSQQVIAPYPVRIYQATLQQLDGPYSLTVERPADALPGRGGIDVALRPSLAGSLQGVREYMSAYPYGCLEQRLSRAVALRNEPTWNAEIARLPLYLDPDGLLRYFPSERFRGSDALTAYVLAIAHEAGYSISDEDRSRMIEALKGVVAGRIQGDSVWPAPDLSIRRLAAIEALSRYDAAEPAMLTSIELEPNLWPTSAVLDWLAVLQRMSGVARRAARIDEARQILRSRVNFQGTHMGFSTERNDALWWLMVSSDVNAARAVLLTLDTPAWREDLPRMMRGLLGRQQRGHWDTTTANAWGTLATEKFAGAFEKAPVSGRTLAVLGPATREVTWPADDGSVLKFPWPAATATLALSHEGGGRPWAFVESRAALPLTSPLFTGYAIHRALTPIEQATKDAWSKGDVVRVRLEVNAQSDMGWVVVDDPVPAGATVLGSGLGGNSSLLTAGERREGWVEPAYEERRFDRFRAYYRRVPKGKFLVEYTLRLNNDGRFVLPPTRVEAMYAPEMFGELPNATLSVGAAR